MVPPAASPSQPLSSPCRWMQSSTTPCALRCSRHPPYRPFALRSNATPNLGSFLAGKVVRCQGRTLLYWQSWPMGREKNGRRGGVCGGKVSIWLSQQLGAVRPAQTLAPGAVQTEGGKTKCSVVMARDTETPPSPSSSFGRSPSSNLEPSLQVRFGG